MTDFRTIEGANGLQAHQSGAFGTPTHWVLTRNGSFVCATNSEVDARIMLIVLGGVSGRNWLWAQAEAVRSMGKEAA